MADSPISLLPAATSTAIGDLVPIAQAGTTKKLDVKYLWGQRTTFTNANYTGLVSDRYIATTTTVFTAPHTVTLPAANALNPGMLLVVSDDGGAVTATNTLSIARAGTDTINGSASSIVLSAARSTLILSSDGVSNWTILARLPFVTPSTQGQIPGTTTNDNALPGNVGEWIESYIAPGTGPVLTSGTTVNVTSIALTAGDWDVFGFVGIQGAAGCVLGFFVGASSSASLSQPNDRTTEVVFPNVAIGTNPVSQAIPTTRYSLASGTTAYLTFTATFTGATASAFGRITARRMR